MTTRRSARGATSERYVVEQTLGSGGMATVYLAVDQSLDRPVALKILAPHLATDESFRDRFVREARLAARLVHPNIVRVYDVGEDDRGPFIVMEYVPGHTLADELRERGRLPPAEVVAIGIQLCAGLEAAHAERLVHRDIKPQNILLRPDGQAKIADFGIVRSLAATQHTEVGTVLGTAAYLAPEQARGEDVSESADIYSVGVVLYELLTGQTPHRAGTPVELFLKQEQGTITPPSDLAPHVPRALDAVVMRCLAFRPEDRPRSAAELGSDLAATLDTVAFETVVNAAPASLGTEILPANAPTRVRHSSPEGRRRVSRGRLVALAVTLGALALLAAALARPGSHSPPPPKAATQAKRAVATTAKRVTTSTAALSQTKPKASPPPSMPATALAAVRAAIAQAQATGQIYPAATSDLNHRLDQIAQSLAAGNETDAGHQLDDLVRQLGALNQHGQLSAAGLTQISTPLDQLAAFIAATPAATPATPTPPAPGPQPGLWNVHGHGHGHGHKGPG
ncbi:MAG TPA: protein kinase [Gaiellaceae bacterium]|nr:protein kinase [Gaiellaceae bacterium]